MTPEEFKIKRDKWIASLSPQSIEELAKLDVLYMFNQPIEELARMNWAKPDGEPKLKSKTKRKKK